MPAENPPFDANCSKERRMNANVSSSVWGASSQGIHLRRCSRSRFTTAKIAGAWRSSTRRSSTPGWIAAENIVFPAYLTRLSYPTRHHVGVKQSHQSHERCQKNAVLDGESHELGFLRAAQSGG